jgi:hypothetical protein
MRIMALVIVAALAACFVNPVAAAQGRVNYYRGNPDRGPYPVSRFCEDQGRGVGVAVIKKSSIANNGRADRLEAAAERPRHDG